MDQRTIQILFALLRSAICGTKLTEKERNIYSPDMLEALLKISAKHDVAHLVVLGLKQNELTPKEEADYEKHIFKAVYRYEKQNYEYNRVCEVLEKLKIPFIPLKGMVIRKYYSEPWMRTSYDIDVLIHENDVEISLQTLCDKGYVRQGGSTHDFGVTAPNKAHVELHYTLSQGDEFVKADEILNNVWDEATSVEINKYLFQMSPELFFLYHLVHMGRHLLHGGCGIRPFIDLWLLENNMPYDKNKLNDILVNTGLLSLYETSSTLGEVWMDGKSHNEQTMLLEKYILFGGVYGNTSNSAQVQAAKGQSKTKTFLKLMLLPRENLEVIYPNLKIHPAMFPLYQIKRWFRFFNKTKRNRVKDLIKARNSVLQKNVDTTKNMLEQLGLLNK